MVGRVFEVLPKGQHGGYTLGDLDSLDLHEHPQQSVLLCLLLVFIHIELIIVGLLDDGCGITLLDPGP